MNFNGIFIVDLTQPSPLSVAEEQDLAEEAAFEERHLERIAQDIANCGSFYRRPDPHNGRTLIPYQVSCGYWRYGCERCLDQRAGEFYARYCKCVKDVKGGVEGESNLGIAQMDDRTARRVTKRMRIAGTEYWRVPTDHGTILVFELLHFESLDNPELHEQLGNHESWLDLCQTPKGKRYSGNLGRPEEEVPEGIVVKIPQYKIEGLEERDITVAWGIALANTSELCPEYDVDEIEEALQERMDEFGEALVTMGGEIVDQYRVMVRVKEERFNWSNKNHSSLGTIDHDGEAPPGFVEESEVRIAELFDP